MSKVKSSNQKSKVNEIRAIIFDMGNVLVRLKPGHEDVGQVWAERVEKDEEIQILWNEVMKGKMDYLEFDSMLVERRIFEVGEVEKMFDRPNVEEVNIELVKLIKKLKKKFKTGLLTNNFPGNIEYYRKAFENYSIFDVAISSHEVGMIKPDPKIFKLVAKRLKCKLENCVFVDDWEKNVEAAIKLGMKGIVFKDNEGLFKELKKLNIQTD